MPIEREISYDRVYNAAHQEVGTWLDRDDVFQNGYLEIAQAPPLSRFLENPQAYLHQSAFYEAVSALRSRERLKAANNNLTDAEILALEPCFGRRDHLLELRAAMRQLKPEEAALLSLRYIEGFTSLEIADMENRDVIDVNHALYRARTKFRQIIGVPDGEPELPEALAA